MRPERRTPTGQFLHSFFVVLGATGMTFAFFLVLPVIQAISKAPTADMTLHTVDAAALPPPPDPPLEEEEEPEEEEKPPEMEDEAPPLDLSQLEMALTPGTGTGWAGGSFGVGLDKLQSVTHQASGALFSLADLDQKPRATQRVDPVLTRSLKKLGGGKVWILFIVDETGRVESPIVQKSTRPEFEEPALAAIKKWRFEPGKRKGQPVSFRMRLPMTFPDR